MLKLREVDDDFDADFDGELDGKIRKRFPTKTESKRPIYSGIRVKEGLNRAVAAGLFIGGIGAGIAIDSAINTNPKVNELCPTSLPHVSSTQPAVTLRILHLEMRSTATPRTQRYVRREYPYPIIILRGYTGGGGGGDTDLHISLHSRIA